MNQVGNGSGMAEIDANAFTHRRSMGILQRAKVHISEYALPILFALGLLLILECGVVVLRVPSYLLPRPSAVVHRLITDAQLFWTHSLVTLAEAVLGFAIAGVLGVLVAVLMASSRMLERIIYPYAVAAKVVPIIAIAPLLMLWLGFGMAPKVVVAVLICFFPIVVNTMKGLKSTETQLLKLMRSLSASPTQTFVKVQLPFALPYIFAGFRISITLSVVGAIVGELVGADKGLGHIIMIAEAYLDTEMMFAAVIASATLGIGLFFLVSITESRVLHWHESLDSEIRNP